MLLDMFLKIQNVMITLAKTAVLTRVILPRNIIVSCIFIGSRNYHQIRLRNFSYHSSERVFSHPVRRNSFRPPVTDLGREIILGENSFSQTKRLKLQTYPPVLGCGLRIMWKLPVLRLKRGVGTSSVDPKFNQSTSGADVIRDIPSSHIPTNVFQKLLLTAGSAYMCLMHASTRPDMIAVLGETTGRGALESILKKMKNDEEGSQLLKDQPRINSGTVDLEKLNKMPLGSLGRTYTNFLSVHKITPDSRRIVQFVDDPDLAYVMQRYREVHDLVHALLGMPINMLGEVTVKWVEGIQTGLPMCVAGALFGPLQLSAKQRKKYVDYHLPWAVQTGFEAKFLMNVYFEKRWEQPVEDILNELNIKPLVVPK